MTEQQQKTLDSFRSVPDAPLFTMDYDADYRLEDFLKTGADSDLALNRFVVSYLLAGTAMDYRMPDMGCSTFAAATKAGNRLLGRNFDEADCLLLAMTTRPKTGYRSISMVNLSYIGITKETLPLTAENRFFLLAAPYVPLDGVNEKGLAMAVLKIRNTPTNQRRGRIPITTTSAIRMVLDRCATVEEAVELLSQYDMHSSANVDFHFQIADAQGGSVIVDYFRDEMHVIPGPCATNFLLVPDVEIGGGHDRFQVLEKTLKETGGIFEDETAAMGLLQAVSGGSTRWSAIYNLTNPGVLLSVAHDYDTLYPLPSLG